MPNQKNWLHQALDWVWDKLLGTLWNYIVVTPYIFSKEKFIQTTKAIYYFLLPKKYIEKKELSAISFLQDSWHYSLAKAISIKFWAYFLTGIVIFGGIGVWIEVVDLLIEHYKIPNNNIDFSKLNSAMLFYITTLLGGICSQVFLDEDIPKNIKSGSWLLIILVYFFTAGVAYTRSKLPNSSDDFFVFCLILTIISLSIAWLINTFNRSLDEQPITTTMLGGDKGLEVPINPITNANNPEQNNPLKGNFNGLEL